MQRTGAIVVIPAGPVPVSLACASMTGEMAVAAEFRVDGQIRRTAPFEPVQTVGL